MCSRTRTCNPLRCPSIKQTVSNANKMEEEEEAEKVDEVVVVVEEEVAKCRRRRRRREARGIGY